MRPPSQASPSHPQNNLLKTKKRWSRQQLLRNLEILDGNLSRPVLPPTLPPSPPASRAPSPAPGFKRKSDPASYPENVKRPRTGSFSDRQPQNNIQPQQQQQPQPHHRHLHQQHHHHPAPTPLPPIHLRVPSVAAVHPPRSEPCEDGEVQEEPVVTSSSRGSAPASAFVAPSQVPIRRPKKGKPPLRHFDSLHDKYHNAGRMLKYSGDARFWSTYSSTHREYRPLADPPPPNSPYHKYGGLIARLELVDALVCFTYSIWNKDYSRRSCNKETWGTIEAFLGWCKQKWTAEEGINDAEKAFVGLIWMIEAFIKGRKMLYTVRNHLDGDMDIIVENTKTKIAGAALQVEENPLNGVNASLLSSKSQATPPMLPSPASIATANSANSTPTNRDGGTPSTTGTRSGSVSVRNNSRPTPFPPGPSLVPPPLLPEHIKNNIATVPPNVMNAMAAVTEPIGPTLVQDLKDLTAGLNNAAYCMTMAHSSLNLPIICRHFPNTFARMMYSTLSPTEEHEPDFEDEEGELFWPGQTITGENLGWLCLMGKAMIKEFGKAYSYNGLDGVVPKPKPEEQTEESGRSAQAQGQVAPSRPGSTPQGHGTQGYGPSHQSVPVSSIQR